MLVTSRCELIREMTGVRALGGEFGAVGVGQAQTLAGELDDRDLQARQIPKNGIWFSRAQRTPSIIPSTPRSPKPPGMSIVEIGEGGAGLGLIVNWSLATHWMSTPAFRAGSRRG